MGVVSVLFPRYLPDSVPAYGSPTSWVYFPFLWVGTDGGRRGPSHRSETMRTQRPTSNVLRPTLSICQ